MEGVERVQTGGGEVSQGVGVAGALESLGFPSRSVFVLGVIVHVLSSDPLGLVNEGPLLSLCQHFPLGSQSPGDLGVVHFWILLSNLPALNTGPDHEGVHGSLDVLLLILVGRVAAGAGGGV